MRVKLAMTKIDIIKEAIAEYDKAVKVKELNQELYDHLLGSVIYVLKYSEKHNIPLPNKEGLYQMVKRSTFLIDRILEANSIRRKLTRRKTDGDVTEPCFWFCQIYVG